MGELSLIERFRAGAPMHPWIAVGPGSDCAVLNWPAGRDQLFKIDQVVEGTHFLLHGPTAATPAQIGWKALAKACSDIAAAGGWPVAATVAMNLRKGSPETLALGVYDGLVACCKQFNIGLAGGDFSTSGNGLSICVSLLGECPKGGAWTRAGAKSGDMLLATGRLGGSLVEKHLNFIPRLNEARRIRELCAAGVHACIDITDGLSRDLNHLCRESGCGAVLEQSAVPTGESLEHASPEEAFGHALHDGEDFELLLAVEPACAEDLLRLWDMPVSLSRIGEIVAHDRGISILTPDGSVVAMENRGYEHHV